MKKSSIFSVISVAILAIFINLFSINLANAAAQDIFIAYVSAKDDDEFVVLHNSGEDFWVDSLNLVRDTKEEVVKIENGIFKGESFLKIPLSGRKIPQSSNFNLKINNEDLPGFCTNSVRNCKISSLKDEYILVNNRLSGGEKFSTISREDFLKLNLDFEELLGEPQVPPAENPTDSEQATPENPQLPAENPENPETPETPTPLKDDCRNFRITEVSTNSGEQFIEIENFSDEISNLKGCVLTSSVASSKDHIFSDQEIEPKKFFVLKISESSLKLNKTTKGEISFFDSEKSQIQSVEFKPLKAESSWAFFEEGWKQTFEITSGEENVFLEFLPCEAGYERDFNTSKCVKIKPPEEEKKCAEGYFLNPESGRCKKLEEPKVQVECAAGYFRNPETGRCKKVEVEDLPTPCASGYYRNPETGRCRKIATLSSATLTPCKEGYYRHPETNHCRKIASEAEELTPCKEGYERNPETNRCRKIVKNLVAEEKVETSDEPKKSEFTGWWAVFGVIFVLISVVLWEFRKPILAFFKKGKK